MKINLFIGLFCSLFLSACQHQTLDIIIPTPIPVPTIKTTPTPAKAKIEGPCIRVFVLTYHHIQDPKTAPKSQLSLTVSPDVFRSHLQYLSDHKYQIITPKNLIDAFDSGNKLSGKLAMITLDDAYVDNYTNMYPVLKEFNYPAVVFVPTGLVNNPGYLSWSQISEMSSLVYFGNHTWSHLSSSQHQKFKEEVKTADTQLGDHGLNQQKILAYPYGKTDTSAINIVKADNYSLAFTTTHGSLLCRGARLSLPRIRVGDAPLSRYGL